MKDFSIIIPIFNEEEILYQQISKIICQIKKVIKSSNYEIILVENGSSDNTYKIAKELKEKYKKLRLIKLSHPSYGQAFKIGIKKSRSPIIVQFDLDFWDIKFLKKSLGLIKKYDVIIGSKNLSRSEDKRSLLRRMLSRLVEKSIRLRFNIFISDTHGLKVIRKEVISPLLQTIKCDNHFFDTELLLKATSLDSNFIELPVKLSEIRSSRFPYLVRTMQVLKEYVILMRQDIPSSQMKVKQKVVWQTS